MTPTTQLRVLRTPLPSCTVITPLRAPARHVVAPRHHVQPCPRLRARTFATGPSSLSAAAKGQTASAAKPSAHGGTPRTTSSAPVSTLSPSAANPPPSTRPAPLELPPPDPESGTFSHLFKTGKAYLTFYKTGLKNTYLNARLVWSLDAASGIPTDNTTNANVAVVAKPPVKRVPEHGSTTRARLLLKRRSSHDIRRLPFFALVLLICGEFTPFIVLALPRAVPYTCRIPRQVESIQRKTEERRRRSFARLAAAREKQPPQQQSSRAKGAVRGNIPLSKDKHAIVHAARSLNLISPLWDRLPWDGSPLLAGNKVRAHLAFLAEDTRLLLQAGGVAALEDAEVVLACVDRGIDVLGVEVPRLRAQLRAWVGRVHNGAGGVSGEDAILAELCAQ